MRRLTVTVPTESPFAVKRHLSGHHGQAGILQQMLVTVHAIFLNDFDAWLVHADHLGFEMKREHEGMARAVHRFKEVFSKDIVVRHVTIVARRHPRMTAPLPGGVLRRHDMTVQARARVVREV